LVELTGGMRPHRGDYGGKIAREQRRVGSIELHTGQRRHVHIRRTLEQAKDVHSKMQPRGAAVQWLAVQLGRDEPVVLRASNVIGERIAGIVHLASSCRLTWGHLAAIQFSEARRALAMEMCSGRKIILFRLVEAAMALAYYFLD
jgi:hypothetical protein